MDRRANSDSRRTDEDNHPERAQKPVRRTILGIDPDRFSILTGTDSTMSNLTGAGRTLDGWLGRGGRLIDTAVTAVASRMGAGPTALFKRLLIPRTLRFTSLNCTCGLQALSGSKVIQLAERDIVPAKPWSYSGDREPEWKTSLRMWTNLSNTLTCSSCRKGYELAVAAEPSFRQDCRGMIKFIQRDANPTSRELALFYVYLLWYLNSNFQQATISSDFAVQLALLDTPGVLVIDAFGSQFGWLARELQRLIPDASLWPGMLDPDHRHREWGRALINLAFFEHQDSYFISMPRQPRPAHCAPFEFLASQFDGLATTAAPDQHNSLMSGLIRFTMSRGLPWQVDPAVLISLLDARLRQRPQACLGHIKFRPLPDLRRWPLPWDRFGSSKELLFDYRLLCSDADVGQFNLLGLVTKILPESLERRLAEWIRSILPDLQAGISSNLVLVPPLWPVLPHESPSPDISILKDVLYHYEQALVLPEAARTSRLSAEEYNDQSMIQEQEERNE